MAEQPILERAARALCSLDGHPENAIMDGKPLWQDYLPEARAVIASIREPSERMLVDALDHESLDARGTSRNIWTAMIDAALEEN